MKILLIGAVDFSYHCFQVLLQQKVALVGVVTTDHPEQYADFADLTSLAKSAQLPYLACHDINAPEPLAWIAEQQPDVIFCLGWSQLIKAPLLALPPKGIVGAHPALIPKNRGRHPLIWAKALGLKQSGLTFFQMDEGADSGAILSQETFEITFKETAFDLYSKVKSLAEIQLPQVLTRLQDPAFVPIAQDLSQGNLWRKRSRVDGKIDWRMSTVAIVNLVRALSHPYPGATFSVKGNELILWAVEPYNGTGTEDWFAIDHEPGKCVAFEASKPEQGKALPIIRTYDGFVVLTEWQGELMLQCGNYLD